MTCCNGSNCTTGIDDFFSREAKKFLERFKKKGLEKSQKNLVEGIHTAGLKERSILEIGCGVGYLHGRLMQLGAKNVTGIDISDGMLSFARKYMKEIGMEKRAQYHKGDFVQISDTIGNADIIILDKVICCYPEVKSLVEKSIEKTKHTYAFTLPRNKWWVKFSVKALIYCLKLFRSKFQPYFHNHEIVNNRLVKNGFKNVYQNHTFIWETYVFSKAGI